MTYKLGGYNKEDHVDQSRLGDVRGCKKIFYTQILWQVWWIYTHTHMYLGNQV